MKLILLHFLVSSAVTYAGSVILIIGIRGIVNLQCHKPFLDRWRHYLSSAALVLGVGMLVDLIPPRLRFTVALPAGVLLFGVIIWVRIKYPGVPARRETTSGKNSV